MASPDSLRQAIQYLHMAIAEHPDPQAKASLAQCLQAMMKVQAQDHQAVSQGNTAAQAVAQRLGGAQAAPPAAANGNPIAALMAHLGGGQ